MKSKTNTERTADLLILLNFEKICELPTNKVFIIDLVDEMNASFRSGVGGFREYGEELVVAALKLMCRSRIYGGDDHTISDVLGLNGFERQAAEGFRAELSRISRQLSESVNVTALIVPNHELNRAICPELVGAELRR